MSEASKANKFRALTDEQLRARLDGLREELYHLRYKMRVEEVENPNAKRDLKRDIARILTVQRERELAAAKATAEQGA